MNSTNDDTSRILLFPTCDRDGLLLDAIHYREDDPSTRADAMLFGWMLGLDAAIDAVGAARAVLAVAAQEKSPSSSAYRRALIDGLERFVADRGRVASLSSTSGTRPRRRWRDDVSAARKGDATLGRDAARLRD